MAGWIKMALGMEVGFGPGHIVLDRWGPSSLSPKKGQSPPIFGPFLLWRNGWMDEDAIWYGTRPQPRPHCVRRGDAAPPRKGHSSPRLFSAHVYCGHSRPSHLLLSSCCTGRDRKCQYFTMGAPIHQNCPFLWEIWTLSNT